ncbi:MAG: hypothetical protein K6E33_07925 [Lachnospiraceae bacterium]|nr:hypothetical protein [Lachnospiraceae bacterium]
MNNGLNTKKNVYTPIWYVCIALTLVAVMIFVGEDLFLITGWYAVFDECLLSGDLAHFADHLIAYSRANYSALSNIIGGIWLLPVYCLSGLIMHGEIVTPIAAIGRAYFVLWSLWENILILLVTFLSIKKINDILRRLGYGRFIVVADILYLITPIVFVSSVGTGQIDCFAVLFMILGIEAFLDGRYLMTSFMMSLSLLYKGMPVMVYLPAMALLVFNTGNAPSSTVNANNNTAGKTQSFGFFNFSDRNRNIPLHIAVLISVPAVNLCLEKFLFPGYREMRSGLQNEINFFDRMLINDQAVNWFILTAGLICVFAVWLSVNDLVRREHYLIMPLSVLTAFCLMVDWNPQWLLILVPFIVLAGCYTGFSVPYMFCYMFMSLGFILSVPISDGRGFDDNGMLHNGILYYLYKDSPTVFMGDILTGISPHMLVLGHTLLEVGAVGILLVLILDYSRKTAKIKTQNGQHDSLTGVNADVNPWLVALQVMPAIIYLVACLAMIPVNMAAGG